MCSSSLPHLPPAESPKSHYDLGSESIGNNLKLAAVAVAGHSWTIFNKKKNILIEEPDFLFPLSFLSPVRHHKTARPSFKAS